MTYIKKLDATKEINTNAFANLSNIVKDILIKSHDRLQDISRHVMWLNITFHGKSKLYMAVRQLKLQLIQQIGELYVATEYMIQGKLPVNFINPTALHNTLRNVSLRLP